MEGWRGRRPEDGPCPACGHELGRGERQDWCGIKANEPWVISCMRSGGAAVPGWRRVKWDPTKGAAVYKEERAAAREAEEWRANRGSRGRDGETERRRDEVEKERARKDGERAAYAAQLWESAEPESGTDQVVLGYFRGRGVELPCVPGAAEVAAGLPWIRFLARCPCSRPAAAPRPDGKKTERLMPGPCILFAVTNARGAVVGVQRIYLDPRNPTKKRADCGNPKKALGALSGGAIRFAAAKRRRDEETECGQAPGLVICEGPETAAAVWVALGCAVPTWSVISTSGMTSVELGEAEREELRGRAVVFAADMDAFHGDPINARPGVKAALAGATRLRFDPAVRAVGVRVGVAIPSHVEAPGLVRPGPGMHDLLGDLEPLPGVGEADGSPRKSVDWLDVYAARGAEPVAAAMARAAAAALAAPGAAPVEAKVVEEVDAAPDDAAVRRDIREGGPSLRLVHHTAEAAPFDTDVGAGSVGGAALGGGQGGEGGGGGDSGGGGGGGGGGGSGGGGEIRIMPPGQLGAAQAVLLEEFSPVDVATHPDGIRARAGERFTVVYLTMQDQWLRWHPPEDQNGARYVPVTPKQMRGKVLHFFEPWMVPRAKAKAGEEPFRPAGLSARTADGIVAAMEGDAAVTMPVLPGWAPATFDSGAAGVGGGRPRWEAGLWLPGERRAEPGVISVRNGLLEVGPLLARDGGRVVLRGHTPRYLSTVCLPYEAPVEALTRILAEDPGDEGHELLGELAPHWTRFVDQLADGDGEWISVLQAWFGYCLTTDISLEAILMVPGPPRSGKGTILTALKALLGIDALAMTSFTSIGERFEAPIFRGRHLAVMSDAHVDQRHAAAAVERVKAMSSGDPVSVESKHRDKVAVEEISIKFCVFTNTLPKLPDPSGALAARLVILPTRRSYSGREDRGLKARIAAEAPGIFAWAVQGLRRLRREGKFRGTDDGREMLEQFTRLSSPVWAFLKDCCVDQAESSVEERLLHELYLAWAEDQGLGRMSRERFFAELQAARPAVRRRKQETPLTLGRGGRLVNAFLGIRPKVAGKADGAELRVFDPHEVEDFGFQFPAAGGDGAEDGWRASSGGGGALGF